MMESKFGWGLPSCVMIVKITCRQDEEMSAAPEAMPCRQPVLIMLLSDGGMLGYRAFCSPIGLRFSRLRLDFIGSSDGRGPHGISSRMTRFEGLGEGKSVYRWKAQAFPHSFRVPCS